jgi:2-iminobutanoate/2-iminopropanoate deaminase
MSAADREQITATEGSKPAGPYSHAIRSGDLLFISGQGPFDNQGKFQGETFQEQALATFNNLALIASAAGGDIHDIVRLGAYLEDISHFAEFNEIMRNYLRPPYPARTTIPVPTLGIPIELDAVIALPPRLGTAGPGTAGPGTAGPGTARPAS